MSSQDLYLERAKWCAGVRAVWDGLAAERKEKYLADFRARYGLKADKEKPPIEILWLVADHLDLAAYPEALPCDERSNAGGT